MRRLILFTLEVTPRDDSTWIEASFMVDVSAKDILLANAADHDWIEYLGLDAFCFDLECSYGVHDRSEFDPFCTTDKDSNPVTIAHIGYHSYEIPLNKLEEVINKWAEKFKDIFGAENVSNTRTADKTDVETSMKALYNRLSQHLHLPCNAQ